MLDALLKLLGSDPFLNFLNTFGLAVLLVAYFVFIRDPKQARYWEKKYDELEQDYYGISEQLNSLRTDAEIVWEKRCEAIEEQNRALSKHLEDLDNIYSQLESDLRPQVRMIGEEQALKLAYIGLDRDLYKLIYYMREKLARRRPEDISFFIKDSVRDTNQTWDAFVSPFPKVPNIGDLYAIYTKSGEILRHELEEIATEIGPDTQLTSEELDNTMNLIWNKLVDYTVDMKTQIDRHVNMLKSGGEVNKYRDEE